jgi:hypothetical protein
MTYKDDLFNVKRALKMKSGRRRKRTLAEALSPNVNYDDQGQPWLQEEAEEYDEADWYDGLGHNVDL